MGMRSLQNWIQRLKAALLRLRPTGIANGMVGNQVKVTFAVT